MRVARPDIAFAVSVLSRHCVSPSRKAWDAAMRVIRYLYGTQQLVLKFHRSEDFDPKSMSLDTFCDADGANCKATRRRILSYHVRLNGNLVAWKSKVSVVTLSTGAAEFYALSFGGRECMFIENILNNFDFKTKHNTLHTDATVVTRNLKLRIELTGLKHLDMRVFWIRQHVRSGRLMVTHVPSKENSSDIGTKVLAGPAFNRLRCMLLD